VQLDCSEAERAARDIRLADSRLRLVGTWHVHPLWDAPRPSSSDRMNALWRLDWRELNPASVSVA
jgi:hypothetical protein